MLHGRVIIVYCGIDIAKRNHEASVIDAEGKPLLDSITITNTQEGCEKLFSLFERLNISNDAVIIGVEATGHYWLAVYEYLTEQKYDVRVINPIQSDAFRKMYIRQTKNDSKASHGRFGEEKAKEIRTVAAGSFGVGFAKNAFAFQIKQLIEQLMFLETQIEELDEQSSHLLKQVNQVITTIPGIGDTLGAIIVSEIGDINRFDAPNKLVAFAGLDVKVVQFGEFEGTRQHISKRGSPYLRRAIWLAANRAAFCDPILSEYYQSLKARGKHHLTAIGAVSRKMCNIIFTILRENRPYQATPPKKII